MSQGKVLISGASGQIGSLLAEIYVSKGWEVHGFVRQRSDLSFLSKVKDSVNLHLQDIRDPHGVWATISDLKPDVIHHCAAMTYVPYSWANPLDTFATNVDATINILQSVKEDSPDTVLHFCGSSEEYGAVAPQETPIIEDTIPKPASPYGVSKYAADLLCQQFNRSYGVKTVITRAFNHESSRRGPQFVSSQVVKQAAEIVRGKREAYSLGNLTSVRDYSDARDIADAYFIAVNSGKVNYGEPYNVCTGVGTTVKELVTMMNVIADMPIGSKTSARGLIIQDPARMRPSDIPVMVGDSTKFRKATEWAPRYTLEDTLRWMWSEEMVK